MSNRSLQDIEDDLQAACLCLSALAEHIADHGPGNVLVLVNIERAADGFKRLMAERRAVVAG